MDTGRPGHFRICKQRALLYVRGMYKSLECRGGSYSKLELSGKGFPRGLSDSRIWVRLEFEGTWMLTATAVPPGGLCIYSWNLSYTSARIS